MVIYKNKIKQKLGHYIIENLKKMNILNNRRFPNVLTGYGHESILLPGYQTFMHLLRT